MKYLKENSIKKNYYVECEFDSITVLFPFEVSPPDPALTHITTNQASNIHDEQDDTDDINHDIDTDSNVDHID